jgi:hypothetical protein
MKRVRLRIACPTRCTSADQTLRRPADERADPAPQGEYDARSGDHAGRRRDGGGPSCRPAAGFPFHPDPQAEGAEAQALRSAAQKALATAISERAERFSRAGERDIVLSLDGYLAGWESLSRGSSRPMTY